MDHLPVVDHSPNNDKKGTSARSSGAGLGSGCVVGNDLVAAFVVVWWLSTVDSCLLLRRCLILSRR